jgi:putative tricarboxylic transport membrane protein
MATTFADPKRTFTELRFSSRQMPSGGHRRALIVPIALDRVSLLATKGGAVRRGRMIACVVLAGIFLAALVTSLGYSLVDALGPGPGFFPFWLSLIGLTLTVAILIESVRSRETTAVNILPNRLAALQGGGVLVALAAAAALFEPLGFRLTMLLFIAGILWVLGARSPSGIAFTAVAGSFGVFHVFLYWLKVPLPTGAFGI